MPLGVVGALLLVRDRGCARPGMRRAALPEVLVVAGERGRLELPAHEPVDRRQQQPLVARELLRGVGAAAREDDGHQIVGAEVALDELPRGVLDELRPQRVDVQVVEDHHVDAAVERPLVALRRPARSASRLEERPVGPLDRNIHEREVRDRLRLAVLEDLEVVLRQVADERPCLVGDERVHLDVVDLRP